MNVFISYGHDCTELIIKVKTYLTECGHTIWMDYDKISGGADWRNAITEGIINSDAVLIFLSRHSLRANSVCLDEIAIASLCNRRIIRPVITEDGLDADIPSAINGIQYFDFTDWRTFLNDENLCSEKLSLLSDELKTMQNDPYYEQMEALSAFMHLYQSSDKNKRENGGAYHIRKWLDDLIIENIHHKDHIPMLLVSFPGFGKSAFCHHFFQTYECAVSLIVCEWGMSSYNNCKNIIQNIAYQIASKITSFRSRLLWLLTSDTVSIQSLNDSELFDLLIVKPFLYEINGNHEELLIILDGVENTMRQDSNNIALLIAEKNSSLPEFVHFLISSRNDSAVRQYAGDTRMIELKPNDSRIYNDIRSFISGSIPDVSDEKVLERIISSCGGSFLIAQLIVNGIRNGVIKTDSPKLVPKNIYSLYFRWMQRIVSESDFSDRYYDAFSVLCAAEEPLSVLLLAHIMKWKRRQSNDFIRLFRQFLIEDTDDLETRCISLFHDSFRIWLDSDQADAYCIDLEEGLEKLAEGLYEMYQEGTLEQQHLSKVWKYSIKAQDDEVREKLLNDEMYLKKLLELASEAAELPGMYRFYEEAVGLCEVICSKCQPTDFSEYCSKISIPLIKAKELFCSGDHLGVIAILEQSVGNIRSAGSEDELMSALRLLGISYDLVGGRDTSKACFEELLTISKNTGDVLYIKAALIGLAWNSHFTDVSKLDSYLKMLSEFPFSDTKEINTYELLNARKLLSEGNLTEALDRFGAVIRNYSDEIWGYDMLSARNQMLLIEAVVACFDNEQFDLGIEYGMALYERLSERGTITECYCASWLAMNYAVNGLTEQAGYYLHCAESINTTSNSSTKSEWIRMHLKSVRAFLLVENGAYEEAAAIQREVAELAEQCADPWVEGDALFEFIRLHCLDIMDSSSVLTECSGKLQSIADESKLPHLLFKSKLIRCYLSVQPSASDLVEIAQTVTANSLPSTDMTVCAYLCMKIAERIGETEVLESVKEYTKRMISEIIHDNPNGKYIGRPWIKKLYEETKG